MQKDYNISEANKFKVLEEISTKIGKPIATFEDLVSIIPSHVQDRLEILKSFKENPKWHPEGNTYEHIKTVTTRLMLTGNLNLVLAGIYHDLGKYDVGELKEGTDYFTSHGHEFKSAKMVLRDKEFIQSLGGDVDEIHTIVVNHMRYKQMDKMRKSKQNAMIMMPTFDKQVVFGWADTMQCEFTNENIYGKS